MHGATIKMAANIASTVLGRVKFHSPSVIGVFFVNMRQFIGDYKNSRFKLRSEGGRGMNTHYRFGT